LIFRHVDATPARRRLPIPQGWPRIERGALGGPRHVLADWRTSRRRLVDVQARMVVVLDNLRPHRPGLVSGHSSALIAALVPAWNGHSTRAMLEGRFRGGCPIGHAA
jgi:hypothetical protein